MSLPGFMRRHRITAEPHAGEGAYGASYGAPVELRVWFQSKRGETRAGDGSTVATSGTVLANLDDAEALNVGARVSWRDSVFYVVAVERHDSGGLVPLEHLEATVG